MAWTNNYTADFGSLTGLTLSAHVVGLDGVQVGSTITTGFVEVGNGVYCLTVSLADGQRGTLVVYKSSDATIKVCFAITAGDELLAKLTSFTPQTLQTDGSGYVKVSSGTGTGQILLNNGLVSGTLSAQPSMAQCVCTGTLYDANGNPLAYQPVEYRLNSTSTTSGQIRGRDPNVVSSDGSGLVTVILPRSDVYEFRYAQGAWCSFTVPAASTGTITEVLGRLRG